MKVTHSELCEIGANWLKKNGLAKWDKPKYVVIELRSIIPSEPDIFGFGSALTQQIEVKVSRSDFLADKKKHHRVNPSSDVGMLRSYLCPNGLISENELPDNWGLLYLQDTGEIVKVKDPSVQQAESQFEMRLMYSVFRRVGVKSQVYNFKTK